jgi:hypothetical protein
MLEKASKRTKFEKNHQHIDVEGYAQKEKKIRDLDKPLLDMPSLLFINCNLIEILRLRENLIKSVHECKILATVDTQ